MSGPSVSPPPPSPSPEDETVRVVPTVSPGPEDETVRTSPAPVGTRPQVVSAAVGLWWAVLVVGVVAQFLVVASGGLSLTATAPDEAGRIALLILVALASALPPVVHWLVLTWAALRLHRGRGRPRPVLSVLAALSLVFDVYAAVSLDRALPIVLSVLHAVLVIGAVVVTWLPGVTTWMAGPVVLVPHQPTPEAPGAGGAAPAGLAAVPVAAEPRPSRARPLVTVAIVVGALVGLVGHVVLSIGGSARQSLEQTITTGVAQQLTTPDDPARCPWALGWDLAMGTYGTSSCTIDVRGRTYPVEVRSNPETGVWWQLRS